MPRQTAHCHVNLPDGSEIVIDAQKIKTCKELLVHVCKIVGLKDLSYFGFSYSHAKDGKQSWFDFEKPLGRQLKKAENQLNLEVQFYPVSSQLLSCMKSIYYFVLQCRRKILSGIWTCSLPSQSLLASFVAQSEFGDYDTVIEENPGYLKGISFISSQPSLFIDNVMLFHKRHKGLSPFEAEISYLESARKMKYYGMDLHTVLDEDANMITLGSNFLGIHVFYQDMKLHSFGWKIISRITSHARELFVHVIPIAESKHEEASVVFNCVSQVDASRIAKLFFEQKLFYTGVSSRIIGKNDEIKITNESCEHTTAMKDLEINFSRISSKKLMELVLSKTLMISESLSDGDGSNLNNSKTDNTLSDENSIEIAISEKNKAMEDENTSKNVDLKFPVEKMQNILLNAAQHATAYETTNLQPEVFEEKAEHVEDSVSEKDCSDASDTEIISDDAVANISQSNNALDVEDSFEKIE